MFSYAIRLAKVLAQRCVGACRRLKGEEGFLGEISQFAQPHHIFRALAPPLHGKKQ
jgi:hypothetical protein